MDPKTKRGRDEELGSTAKRRKGYSGGLDSEGNPHGRGTLKFGKSGVSFRGTFAHGEKHGRGCMFFDDGSSLKGKWVDDELHGLGIYTEADGEVRENTYDHGECTGPGREFDLHGNLVFEGAFSDGVRHGAGEARMFGTQGSHPRECDGWFVGTWDDGELDGDASFFYSDGSSLRGAWAQGALVRARFVDAAGRPPRGGDEVYTHDPSTTERIATQPLLADPYEAAHVRVAPSRIAGAGEGLFAAASIPAGRIVAWYNGLKVSCAEASRVMMCRNAGVLWYRIPTRRSAAIDWSCEAECSRRFDRPTTEPARPVVVRPPPRVHIRAKVDARPDWSLNDNVMNLNEEIAIDVPPAWSACAAYRATLGHKANHADDGPNAEYDFAFHPRFGDVKCVRATRTLAPGDEITVDYAWADEFPPWYQHAATYHEARAARSL
jgi:hypothetical protein